MMKKIFIIIASVARLIIGVFYLDFSDPKNQATNTTISQNNLGGSQSQNANIQPVPRQRSLFITRTS